MSAPPNVFISATSADLGSARRVVRDALLNIDCHPVVQDHFGPDYREVRKVLRERIAECQALVHIVGFRYGAEPDPALLPPGTPHRSYTQMEYDLGRELQAKRGEKRFRVYTFLCPEDFPYDPAPDAEDPARRDLQLAHRRAILGGEILYETPADAAALSARIHALREEARALRAERDRQRRWMLAVGLAIFLALGGIAGGVYWYLPHRVEQSVIDPALIGERLRSEIRARFERDAEAARSEGRHWEALRELEKNRDAALARVDEVVTSIRDGLAGNPDPIFREASRILEKEGSDAALGYLESHRADLLARADRAAAQAESAQARLKQDLQPLLLQADLLETRQDRQGALDLLRTVADKAPGWWEARLRLGNLLHELARYAEAESQLRAALALAADEKDQAEASNDLAALLYATNRLAEAEPLIRRALAIDERSYDPEHPDVARDLNTLAQLLKATNRLAEAEPLMRRVLAIDEKSYGPEHPEVAIDLNNLARLLQATNRLAEAEPLVRRALAIDEKSYGPAHPEVAIDLNNLARLLKATDRLAEAEPLMRRALAIDEKSYGPAHPKVATHLNDLAQLLQATDRLAEAEPLMRRALAIDEKSYGPEHPDVAIDLTNLTSLMYTTNRLAEAEPLMRRVVEIFEKSYGPEHPNVAAALNNLAQLLQATHRPGEAEPPMRRVVEIFEKSYGPEHPNVATALNNLAWLLQDTNRLAEAEPLERRAVLVLLKSSRAAGHELPNLRVDFDNYRFILAAQKLPPSRIAERFASLGREAGYGAAEWAALQSGLEGARIAGLVPGGQAERLGLQPGDTIVRYAGRKIEGNAQLVELTGQIKTPAIPLILLRAGKEITLTAQPGKLGVRLQ